MKHPASSDLKKCGLPSELFSLCVLATGPGRLQTIEVQKELGSVLATVTEVRWRNRFCHGKAIEVLHVLSLCLSP
jgi:hypothetical protein